MSELEISTVRDAAGADVVVIKDGEMREVTRVEALSPDHARSLARDCAMVAVKTGDADAVVLTEQTQEDGES